MRFSYPWLAAAPALARTLVPSLQQLEAADVSGAIFVQAGCAPSQGIAEAEWALELGRSGRLPILGVVAFVPVDEGALTGQVDRLTRLDGVVGVRHVLQEEPVAALADPRLADGLRKIAAAGLRFDACVRYEQLDALAGLLEEVPELDVVIDHAGNPPVGDRAGMLDWTASMHRLAGCPRLFVKLSGSVTAARPREVALEAARLVLEEFGADRCMIGSDWPVTAVLDDPGSYARSAVGTVDALGLSASERRMVEHESALVFYGLSA